MWRMERHVPRGGGNSLKSSHNQDFSLIEAFNNLALWGEKKFVSELKRTYKFQRGVNNKLDCHANQTRILSKEYSFVAGATHVALCDSRHWCGAFTLAEVLITLGIIGVVAALTLPALINNYEKSVVETRMQKFYTNINAALKLSIVENGDMVDWTFPQDYYDADGSEQFFNTYLKNNLQYLKTVPRVTTSWPTNGIEVDLNDGSAFVLSGTWITYYPNANKKQRSGVDSFIFIINKNGNSVIPHGNELKLSENTLKKVNDVVYSCNGNTHRDYNRSCAAYIMQNGWKIPEYYPWGDLKKVK